MSLADEDIQDKLYYGTSKVVADQFNEPEVMARFKHPNESSLYKRFPRCICIGSIKSGTQALLEFLELHSAIKSVPFEVRYFKLGRQFDVVGYEKEYLSKMPYSTKYEITFEKSPQYTQDSDQRVAARLQHFDPSMKLLFVVKHPIDRALGEYLHHDRAHFSKHGTHLKPFRELITNRDGTLKRNYPALQTSAYHRVLSFWYQVFPSNQIHIVDGDELLRKNPSSELSKIEKFLNLKHELTEHLFYFNETKGFYCYTDVVHNNRTKCLWPTKGNKHPDIDPDLLVKLKKFYKPLNQQFYSLAGRTFNWD